MSQVKWLGSTVCDFCGKELSKSPEGTYLFDAKTRYGCWAVMCNRCFRRNGRGALGIGLGQKYVKRNGKFTLEEEKK